MILHIILKIIKVDDMAKIVKVIDTSGLSIDTISKIEKTMLYVKDCFADDGVKFAELHNSQGDIIRIFPERIEDIIHIPQKKQYVLVGTEAVLLYEEQEHRDFSNYTNDKVAQLIKDNKADIFVYPEDDLDEDMAFAQFIEQINGWDQIAHVDKEYVDEINKLL